MTIRLQLRPAHSLAHPVSAGSEVIFLFIALLVLVRLDVLFNYNMWLYMMLMCCCSLIDTLSQMASIHYDMP